MSKQKTEDTSQPGKPKTSPYNKFDNKIEQFIGPIVSEESAILAAAQVLMAAFDVALQKHDESTMIDIADRWIAISQVLGQNTDDQDEEDGLEFKMPVGFLSPSEEEDRLENEPEQPNDSQSRVKVRQKSRKL